MCLADLYSYDADQREAIAKVESLLAMRNVVADWRAHYRSTPVASAEASPCVEAGAAGAYSIQGEAA